ncbi:hypothetical protein J437_LFUL005615 [Ladona fulva]|uniref:Uncharacterized protein n=1 Tax=Ladona fulva TaxID=123851 RepID=A0A8K0K4F3_LADFU|nr:hypothetical protein J437_LFUL005615 [Ladona fulva]
MWRRRKHQLSDFQPISRKHCAAPLTIPLEEAPAPCRQAPPAVERGSRTRSGRLNDCQGGDVVAIRSAQRPCYPLMWRPYRVHSGHVGCSLAKGRHHQREEKVTARVAQQPLFSVYSRPSLRKQLTVRPRAL